MRSRLTYKLWEIFPLFEKKVLLQKLNFGSLISINGNSFCCPESTLLSVYLFTFDPITVLSPTKSTYLHGFTAVKDTDEKDGKVPPSF